MENQFASLESQRADHNSHFQSSPIFSDDNAHESIAGNSSFPRGSGWFESLKRWFTPATPQGQTVNICSPSAGMAVHRESVSNPHPLGSFVALCVSAGFHEPGTEGRPVFRVVFRTAARRQDGSAHVIGIRFYGPFRESNYLWKFLGYWRGWPLTRAELEAGIGYGALFGTSAVITVSANRLGQTNLPRISRIAPCSVELSRNLKRVVNHPKCFARVNLG